HEGRVAAGSTAPRYVVLALGFVGQREEALEHFVGAVDQRLVDAMAADAGEPPLAVGRAEFGNESLAVGFAGRMGEASDIEGGDALAHGHSAAALTAAASCSRVSSTSATSSASTVTRTTGSVPEGRRKARPRPCTAPWAASSAACTAGASAGLAPLR